MQDDEVVPPVVVCAVQFDIPKNIGVDVGLKRTELPLRSDWQSGLDLSGVVHGSLPIGVERHELERAIAQRGERASVFERDRVGNVEVQKPCSPEDSALSCQLAATRRRSSVARVTRFKTRPCT